MISNPCRGDLVTALREKYFGEAEFSAKDFEGWKPDEIHEVNAKTWKSVDIYGCLLYTSDAADD